MSQPVQSRKEIIFKREKKKVFHRIIQCSISQKGQIIPLCFVPEAETSIYFHVALDMDTLGGGYEYKTQK